MGTDNEFGPDTETIRAWLAKRATYAKDARVIGAPRGSALGSSTPVAEPEGEDPPAPPRLAPGQVDSVGAGRSIVEALSDDLDAAPEGPTDAPGELRRAGTPDSTTAGRSVVEALTGDQPHTTPSRTSESSPGRRADVPPAAAPERRTPATSTRRGSARISVAPRGSAHAVTAPPPETIATGGSGLRIKHSSWTEPEEHREALQASTDVDFPMRSAMRRAMSLILLSALAATVVAGYVAYQEQTAMAAVVAGVMGFLTLVVWAVRASVTTVQLTIRRGQLRIVRGGRTEVVDLASPYTPVAIIGEPGQRQWTVLAERPGLPLVVINASMVDPYWFTTALYRLRPELRPGSEQPSSAYAAG